MFQFSGFATIQQIFNLLGFPIRTRTDQSVVCTSPYIFAAYHVLRRLQEPRHPPCALIRFLSLPYAGITPARLCSSYFHPTKKHTNHLKTNPLALPFYLHFSPLPALSMNFLIPLIRFQVQAIYTDQHNNPRRVQQ